MADRSVFETVTLSRNDRDMLCQLRSLVDQSAIKIVDIRQRGGLITIVFRRLSTAL